MHTRLCDEFGTEFPIFAFTHCRDVVAEVSRAGGLGVLGAVGFTPDQLEVELAWIDDHVEGKPYGVDFVMPAKQLDIGDDSGDIADMVTQLQALIPERHRKFVGDLVDDFDLPRIPADEEQWQGTVGWTPEVADQLVDITFGHDVSLVVNALGTPPPHIIDRAHHHGAKVAALAGKVQHAESHARAGVDVVIAQGTEAGGHTGEIATMVLLPEVVEAIGPDTPILAAGGIARGQQVAAALALGADGVWTGSVWLTTAESDTSPEVIDKYLHASSSDTVRSRSFSGKPARMLRTPWTEAWEADDAPETLGMPLQNLLIAPAMNRFIHGGRLDEMFAPVGQVVGAMDKVRPVRDVIYDMVEEYLEATNRLESYVEAG